MSSSFAKVYILNYGASEKAIKSDLFAPFQLSEKMPQKIGSGAGWCRKVDLSIVGRGSGFAPALRGFLSAWSI